MFSDCKSISDIVSRARELKANGANANEVNVLATKRRMELVQGVNKSTDTLEKHRVTLSSEELMLKGTMPYEQVYGNRAIFEIDERGVIRI